MAPGGPPGPPAGARGRGSGVPARGGLRPAHSVAAAAAPRAAPAAAAGLPGGSVESDAAEAVETAAELSRLEEPEAEGDTIDEAAAPVGVADAETPAELEGDPAPPAAGAKRAAVSDVDLTDAPARKLPRGADDGEEEADIATAEGADELEGELEDEDVTELEAAKE
uniref:Uncharacterized protein n=1 Tax=Calcidiscus leptoporus TaxID=127549 RepID=A0A7S0IZU8_9EUKA